MEIRTGFWISDLFGAEDTEGINREASAARYAELLTGLLREAYPDAEIEVVYRDGGEGSLPYDMQTAVDGRTDVEEVAWVATYCDCVYNDMAWAVEVSA